MAELVQMFPCRASCVKYEAVDATWSGWRTAGAAGIYVGDTDDAPGAAVMGIC